MSAPIGIAFNSEPAEEELKGNPRFIRIEKQDSGGQESHLQVTAEYILGAKIKESQACCSDGTFSYRTVYEYSYDGRLSRQATYWHGDLCTETISLPQNETGIEEVIVLSSKGQELDRIVTQRDEAGQVLECTSTDLSENRQVHLVCRYDDLGQPVEGRVTFQDRPEMDLRIDLTKIDTSVQIDSRDAIGNWTKKTTPTGILYRTIEYY